MSNGKQGRSNIRRDHVPAAEYSEEVHRLEMERVWPKVWQVACREEEIPNPGDYVNYEIGQESILVVRSASGGINAFYNVCPHRGRRLRDDERGNMKSIFCGYHAWAFDLDGKVNAIPSREDWQGCPATSDEDFSLTRVQCDTWAGWVWINMDPDCVSLQEYLGPMVDQLGVWEWEHCRIRSYQTLIFPVNWKVVLEAFVEPYHVVGTHPQLLRWGHGRATGVEKYLVSGQRHGGHTGARDYEFDEDAEFQDPREYLVTSVLDTYHNLHGLFHEDGLRAVERLKTEVPPGLSMAESAARFGALRKAEIVNAGARYPERVTDEDQFIFEWLLFPNSSVLTTVEGAFWYRARPYGDSSNSTIFDIYVLGRYAPGKEPKWTHEVYTELEDFKGKNPILEQDFSNMIAVQKGMRSRGFKAARPNPVQESQVSNFHRVLQGSTHGTDEWAEIPNDQ